MARGHVTRQRRLGGCLGRLLKHYINANGSYCYWKEKRRWRQRKRKTKGEEKLETYLHALRGLTDSKIIKFESRA